MKGHALAPANCRNWLSTDNGKKVNIMAPAQEICSVLKSTLFIEWKKAESLEFRPVQIP